MGCETRVRADIVLCHLAAEETWTPSKRKSACGRRGISSNTKISDVAYTRPISRTQLAGKTLHPYGPCKCSG